jgi:hypothetical protein
MAGAGHRLVEELRHEAVGLALADQVRVLGGIGVAGADPERDPKPLTHCVARALMVGMGVGERVGVDLLAGDLAQDPTRRVAGRRVDQDVADHVDVDRVRWKAR